MSEALSSVIRSAVRNFFEPSKVFCQLVLALLRPR